MSTSNGGSNVAAVNGIEPPEPQRGEDSAYAEFEALHSAALEAAGLPKVHWRKLFYKLSHEIYDAGQVFGILQVEAEPDSDSPARIIRSKVVVTRESGLKADDPDSIFLVDHAWTYRPAYARQQLLEVPGLMSRMSSLMGLDFHGEEPDPEAVELLLQEMWKYNQTYHLNQGSAEEKVPVWYVLDEFGSQIQHSDWPSCGLAPFYHISEGVAYSLLWPLRDLEEGDEVSRDFAYGESNPLVRKCRLLPWKPLDLDDVSSETAEPPDEYYQAVARGNRELLPEEEVEPVSVPQGRKLK